MKKLFLIPLISLGLLAQLSYIRQTNLIQRLLDTNPLTIHNVVYCPDLYREGDGLGGSFKYNNSSTRATNILDCFKPTGTTGRWIRMDSPVAIGRNYEDAILLWDDFERANTTEPDIGAPPGALKPWQIYSLGFNPPFLGYITNGAVEVSTSGITYFSYKLSDIPNVFDMNVEWYNKEGAARDDQFVISFGRDTLADNNSPNLAVDLIHVQFTRTAAVIGTFWTGSFTNQAAANYPGAYNIPTNLVVNFKVTYGDSIIRVYLNDALVVANTNASVYPRLAGNKMYFEYFPAGGGPYTYIRTHKIAVYKRYGNEVFKPAWNTVQVPFSAMLLSGTNSPGLTTYGASGNLLVPFFQPTTANDQVYFSVTLPQDYQEGGVVFPQILWTGDVNDGTTNVVWGLDYSLANIGNVSPAPTTVRITNAAPAAAWTISRAYWPRIDTLTNTTGATFIFRLFRDQGSASDLSGVKAFVPMFLLSYPSDGLGAQDKWSKAGIN